MAAKENITHLSDLCLHSVFLSTATNAKELLAWFANTVLDIYHAKLGCTVALYELQQDVKGESPSASPASHFTQAYALKSHFIICYISPLLELS